MIILHRTSSKVRTIYSSISFLLVKLPLPLLLSILSIALQDSFFLAPF
nr:MAG TPA: hypothetical protein [Bacteriophage sp.]